MELKSGDVVVRTTDNMGYAKVNKLYIINNVLDNNTYLIGDNSGIYSIRKFKKVTLK